MDSHGKSRPKLGGEHQDTPSQFLFAGKNRSFPHQKKAPVAFGRRGMTSAFSSFTLIFLICKGISSLKVVKNHEQP